MIVGTLAEMNPTFIGLSVAFLSVLIAISLEGAHFLSFFKISALLLIIGGTAGATFASFSLEQIKDLILNLQTAVFPRRKPLLANSFWILRNKPVKTVYFLLKIVLNLSKIRFFKEESN